MPYDSSLDNRLFSKSWENDTTKLTVSIYSYNNGPKKLQISRETKDSEGELRFGKMGLLNKEEFEAILPFLQEASSQF